MADSRFFLEVNAPASGVVAALASIPSGADNAIIRMDSGTARWSESNGSWLSATAGVGLLFSAADPPFRIGNGVPLSAFRFAPVGGGATLQISYYSYHGIGQYL